MNHAPLALQPGCLGGGASGEAGCGLGVVVAVGRGVVGLHQLQRPGPTPKGPTVACKIRTKPAQARRTTNSGGGLRVNTIRELLDETPAEELLKRVSPEERLKGLPPDDLPAALSGLSPDELLAALSPEIRAALAQRLKENGSPPNPGGK